ncbi:sialidase family protein [Coraliomargarita sp. W4R53]
MKKVLITLVFFTSLVSTTLSLRADAEFPPPLDFRYPQMPYLNWNPGAEYDDSARMFQGIPSIASAPNGRLWATWYGGGTGESQANYVLLATSGDDGRSWSSPKLIVNPPFRASEPAVWTDPSGKLWFMFNFYPIRSSAEDRNAMSAQFEDTGAYNQFIGKYNFVGTQLWAMTTDNPDDEDPTWAEPRIIGMEIHNMNKPTVLSDGTWVWPAAPVTAARGMMMRPLYSTDEGRSFFYRGAVPMPKNLRNANEYQIIERKDGSLWLLNRVNGGIGESFSYDGGETWTTMELSSIVHTVSRFYITRLQSGKLLLVKHGAIDKDVGRSQLMAFLSEDDGETWTGGLMIDARPGISYPDGEQGEDGLIRITYDYSRHHAKEILMAVFSEQDVAAGKAVSGQAAFRLIVNKATGHNYIHERKDSKAVQQWMLDAGVSAKVPDDAEPLRKESLGLLAVAGVEAATLELGAQLFSDRDAPTHLAADIPKELSGAQFLRLPISGQHRVRVTRSGMVYFLTTQPERNAPDTQSQALLDQGFKAVALPEFYLFAARTEKQLVTLYQKEVKQGDRITIGKWAVPVFFP